jgi:CDP-glucose 4,6-dehydratase
MSIRERLRILSKLEGPILVTGHTGFKGTWLGVLLEELSIPFIGLSLPPEPGSLYERLSFGKPRHEYFQDIRDKAALARIVAKESPSCLIHLAAQPLVLESFKNPLDTFEINVLGTANILEAFRLHNPNSVLGIVTTDKVYRPAIASNHRHREDDQILGTEPYSASKASVENVVVAWQALSHKNDQPILALRSGNVIGGGDSSANRLLPDLIRSYLSNSDIEIRFPSATRPWQHVLDPLYGYLLAIAWAFETRKSNCFNFGPTEDSLSVRDVVAIADKAWGYKSRPLLRDSSAFGETKDLMLDSSRARSLLLWGPSLDQAQAVISTVNWWKKSIEFGPDKATLLDVSAFLK